MKPETMLLGGLVLVIGLFGSGIVMLRALQRQERINHRVQIIHGANAAQPSAADLAAVGRLVVGMVTVLGRYIVRSGLLSRKSISDLEKTLSGSGLRDNQGLALFVGCKILLMAALPLVAWLACVHLRASSEVRMVVPAIAGVLGLLLPDWMIRKYRARYIARLEYGLPDALDMMVICAQAGLGLGPAIIRVATELQLAYKELAVEFGLLAHELQISTDSRTALSNIGIRTELDSLKRLGATLIQTLQYGTPLTDGLKILSSELRQEMMTRLETKAARLPVMITVPMILFILPCIFLVAGGPAVIQISKALAP